jgi:hypothetical protein
MIRAANYTARQKRIKVLLALLPSALHLDPLLSRLGTGKRPAPKNHRVWNINGKGIGEQHIQIGFINSCPHENI